jgi:oligogalacturonide lyase
LLSLFPASLVLANVSGAGKRRSPLPQTGEFVRFADPLTENFVVRLTHPGWQSILPSPRNRFISAKERFLIYSSNRDGRRLAPWAIDLRTGRARVLGEAKDLVASSLCLDTHERTFYLLDGTTVKEVALPNLRVRTLAEGIEDFTVDLTGAQLLAVKNGQLTRVGDGAVISKELGGATDLSVRPSGEGCFFQRGESADYRELWYISLKNPEKPKLLAKGKIWNFVWNPNGASVLFLREAEVNGVFIPEIHEILPDAGAERTVERTNQFAAFAPNGNGSVFVGASRSKAQPAIDLMLRSPQRELTLCEHRSKEPASVAPVFSPDSRRVYFQSDREGRWALYAVNVERLVEPTL